MASCSCSCGNGFTLQLNVVEESYSVENNSSVVAWELLWSCGSSYYKSYTDKFRATINGVNVYNANKSVSFSGKNTTVKIASGTTTIAHDEDGQKIIDFGCGFTLVHNTTDYRPTKNNSATSTMQLSIIPRATTPALSPTSTTLGKSITISMPRASSNFTHRLYFKVGNSAKTTIATDLDESYTYTVPRSWANYCTNAVIGTATIYCTTYLGTQWIGEKSVDLRFLIPDDMLPTISNFTIVEAVSEVKNKIGKYLKGKSKLSISFDAKGDFASTIKSTEINVGTLSYTGNSVTTDVLPTSGSLEVKVTAKDTRGRTKSESVTINVEDYAVPYISAFNIARCDADGNETESGEKVKATINAGVTNIDGNTATYKIGYKLQSSANYTYITLNKTALSLNESIILSPTFNTDNGYDIVLVVTDVFGAENKVYGIIETEFVLVDYYNDGTGMAIGKVAEKSNLLDVGLPTMFQGGVTPVDIFENEDLNDYTQGGFYRCRTTATAQTLLNCPIQYAFHMYVGQHTANGCVQMLFQYTIDRDVVIYVRNMYNDSWGNWCELATTNDLANYLLKTGGTIDGDLSLKNLTASAQIKGNKLVVDTTASVGGNLTVGGTINGIDLKDTGWVDCTFESGFSAYSGSDSLAVRRVGKVVYLRGYITNSSTVSATTTAKKFATIPEGFRPSANISHMCQGSNYNSFQCTAFPNGALNMARYGADGSVPSGSWLCVSGMSWLVD